MKESLLEAFRETCRGYSPDRVVADPEINRTFLDACSRRGLTLAPAKLNQALLNSRKGGLLRGIRSRRTILPSQGDYRFAAEIAARYLERRAGCSLDEVICDPALVEEFDALAASIAPGGAPLAYRWAALNLRKQKRLAPELLARVARPVEVIQLKVEAMAIASVPSKAGLYLFYSSEATLYVGEAENLQNRIRKHLDHSDNKHLARWLWEQTTAALHLELQVLDETVSHRIRRALELELIRSRAPLFNIQR